jgi:hypothetical protein
MHQFLQVILFWFALGFSILYVENVIDHLINKVLPGKGSAALFSVVVTLWTLFYLVNLEAVK